MTDNSVSPPNELRLWLRQARAGLGVVAAMLTSHHCPWCKALRTEQLIPRIRSTTRPTLVVLEFDIDNATTFELPDGKRTTAKAWGERYGLRVTPTLCMLDDLARPLPEPLVGYTSRDFYAAYLEDQIRAAHAYWQSRQNRTP